MHRTSNVPRSPHHAFPGSHKQLGTEMVHKNLYGSPFTPSKNEWDLQGRFQKKIKGSSSVGEAATPPMPFPSCYRVKRRGD